MTVLSRIEIPLADRQVQRLLANPYALHQAILVAFPHRSEGGTGRVMFRVEPEVDQGAACVLVQSDLSPDWHSGASMQALPRLSVSSKSFAIELQVGQKLRFRLRFNPTAKREGRRCPIVGEEAQYAWLRETLRGERLLKSGHPVENAKGGLELLDALLIDEGRVTGYRSADRSGFPLTFHSVRAEGAVSVTEIDKAIRAVLGGVGPGKAFGFGLVSLARV